jgi:branched-chain amino acid transport system permease protein
VVDTLGRAMLPLLLRSFFDRQFANAAGPALASVSIYVLMAFVLAVRPQGLFRAARQ